MKSSLILTPTTGMDDTMWVQFRNQIGIGASEVASIMGLDQYRASIQVFNDKVFGRAEQSDSIAMFMGRYMEDKVADLWQYWDGTPEGMMKNYEAGAVQRKCRRVNAFIQNPDYPWLFASPDRIINKNGKDEEAILEIKTISGFAANMWEGGIPPAYVVQLQTYLLVTDLQYGELAMLKDGRYLEVFPFERNQSICDHILEKTYDFWQLVLQGREVKDDKEKVFQIAPLPDGSVAWEDYLKEQYKGDRSEREGTQEEYELAKDYIRYDGKIKEMEVAKTECSNKIKHSMGDTEILNFGAAGKINWKANAKGVRSFRPVLKEDLITELKVA